MHKILKLIVIYFLKIVMNKIYNILCKSLHFKMIKFQILQTKFALKIIYNFKKIRINKYKSYKKISSIKNK
jgi:hypothetical protein